MENKRPPLDWPSLIATEQSVHLIPQALQELAHLVQADTRESLFRIGDSVRYIYLVVSGEVRLIRVNPQGNEVILQRCRGGFIAEASLDSRAYHCDGVAVEPTTLLLFPAAVFRATLEDDLVFRKGWRSLLANEVRKLRAQCERLSLHSAVDRIGHYIESEGTNGVVNLSQSRKAWASELGLTHEALYRALRRMQDDGLLAIDGHQFISKPKS